MILRHRDRELLRFEWTGLEGAANTGFKPYSEYYAAQVAEALGLPHVEYGLENFKGRICSKESLSTQLKANLKADPYVTVDELADILPVPKRAIERRLKALRDAGEIVHEGGRSGGYWRVLK